MTQRLAELVYISTPVEDITPSNVKSILESARINNAKYNITGLLCYDNARFLQIIEGPKCNIKELYYTVAQDKRHDSLELIHFDDIEAPSFTRWQMAFKGLASNMVATLSDETSILNFYEARGMLNNTNYSFGAGLFSLIMDSAYSEERSIDLNDELEWMNVDRSTEQGLRFNTRLI